MLMGGTLCKTDLFNLQILNRDTNITRENGTPFLHQRRSKKHHKLKNNKVTGPDGVHLGIPLKYGDSVCMPPHPHTHTHTHTPD